MTTPQPGTVSTTVPLDPGVAFEIFVEEIERWWRPGPDVWNDPGRAIGIRFERGAGGRWIERYDLLDDDVFVLGEITSWEPGARIAMTCHWASGPDRGYPLEIQFTPNGHGADVTVIHDRPLGAAGAREDRSRPDERWESVLGWFHDWATWGSARRLATIPGAAHPYVLHPGEGVNGDPSLKATRRSTSGRLSIMDFRATGGAPDHVHRNDDEVFYVLDGTLTVTFAGETHELGPGGVACIPAGTTHAWDTIGDARVLIVAAPGGLEEFLAALHSWPNGYEDAWRVLGERYGYTLR